MNESSTKTLLQNVPVPHCGQIVYMYEPAMPQRAMIVLHGRGGAAEPLLEWGIQALSETYILAPQAAQHTWYPRRFMEPLAENQPDLTSALAVVDALVAACMARGFLAGQLIIAGFSQGACLAAEYAKQNPRRYAALLFMSGGLPGTDGEVCASVPGTFSDTPVYIGCDNADQHIPWQRVLDTEQYFTTHGADTFLYEYHGFGHQPHPDAVRFLQQHIA